MISRSGKLFNKVLIVTQEASGTFGPKIGPSVMELERKFGNIEVYPSEIGRAHV